MNCLFCDFDPAAITWRADGVFALRDRFPVSPGHTLIAPRRHVATWFDATRGKQQALLDAIAELKLRLDAKLERMPWVRTARTS